MHGHREDHERDAGDLVQLAWRPTSEVYTQVAWNDRRSLTPAMTAFIDTARTTFGVT